MAFLSVDVCGPNHNTKNLKILFSEQIVLYVYFGIIALIYILEFSNHIDIYEKNKISIA